MKILFITESFPYPLDSGGKIVSYQMLEMLAAHHNVSLIALTDKMPTKTELRKITSLGIKPYVVILKRNPWYKLSRLELLKTVLILKPPIITMFYEKNVVATVSKLLTHNCFDVIHIDHLSMAQYLPKTKKETWILHEHNIEYELYKNFYHISPNFSKEKFVHLCNALMLQRYEHFMVTRVDQIILISRQDKQKLIQWGVGAPKMIVIPPYAMSEKLKNIKEKGKKELLFIGNLWWKPNLDAVMWFLKSIFPLIQKADQSVSLTIIGEGAPLLSEYTNDNPSIMLLDKQSDISRFLHRATLFILPFRIGQGIRIKALTAFSCGLPVVSTAVGMRGLQARAEKEYLEAKNPQEFAKQVLMLIRHSTLQTLLASNAKRFLQTQHNPIVIQRYLQKHYGK
jgi:polysaccharide biosynthesis protein PslH